MDIVYYSYYNSTSLVDSEERVCNSLLSFHIEVLLQNVYYLLDDSNLKVPF